MEMSAKDTNYKTQDTALVQVADFKKLPRRKSTLQQPPEEDNRIYTSIYTDLYTKKQYIP